MPTVKTVEAKIWKVEGFRVRILHLGGSDVRSDFGGLPNYNDYERAASGETTVADWKETRFKKAYPGFQVDILNGRGESVHGATKLANVRDSY
ncbi:MAG TPA: hypothetical protein VM934_09155 [Pyrinomonadaceae bacterium]|jgi:hypothetical protein|nr:hypothetical protein [Pyrinomonadaceae bacterium]